MNQPSESDASIKGGTRRKPGRRSLRILAWTGASVLFLVVFCLVAVTALLDTGKGHRFLLNLAEQKGSEALGVPVRLQNFVLHLSSLSLDLYGIQIAGADPHLSPPLLQADHVGLSVRIISAWKRKWYFDNIRIDHPAVWLAIDKDGVSNLPAFKSSGSSNTDLFDLGIRHFQLARGEAYYNSCPSAISADLHNVAFSSAFNSVWVRYSGRLSYSGGRVIFGSLRPVQHNLEAEFEAGRDVFLLTRAKVTTGNSAATISATLRNYSNPAVQAHYDIVVDGSDVAKILNEPAIPSGLVQTTGMLRYQRSLNQSLVDSLALDGEIFSAGLDLSSTGAHVRTGKIAAHYSLANGDAILHDFRAQILGGALALKGSVRQIDGNSSGSFDAALQKASLADAMRALGQSKTTGGVSLCGAAGATATVEWRHSIENLIAHADLTLDGSAIGAQAGRGRLVHANAPANAAPAAVPIHAALHAVYTNANRSLTLRDSFLRSSQTQLTMSGTAGRHSRLSVGLEANDLSEIATFANLFRNPGAGAPILHLTGHASFQGNLSGSIDAPSLTGQLIASNVGYNGTQWKLLQTSVVLNASHAALQNLRLESSGRGQVAGSAAIELHHWRPGRQSPIQVEIHASQLNLADLTVLAAEEIPVTGTLNASAHLGGKAMNPTGSATLALTGMTVEGESISRIRVDLNGSGKRVSVSASAQLPAGTVQASVTVDSIGRTFQGQLTANAIDLSKFHAIEGRGIQMAGVAQIQANAQGSFDNPEWQLGIAVPKLTSGGQTISQLRLQANATNHVANFELSTVVASATVSGKARLTLGDDYLVDASLDTQPFPLQPFLAAYAPEEEDNLSGEAEIHATLHGPLKNRSQLQAHVKMPVLKLDYNNAIQLAATPIQADYQNGAVTLQPVTIQGTDTRLNLRGVIPAGGPSPASLQAQGTVNLQVIQIFDPDLRASGSLNLHIDYRGAIGPDNLAGEIEIADASISSETSPVALEKGNGVLKLTGNRIDITKFNASLGGGDVTAQGGIAFRPKLQMDLGLAAKGAILLYPQGVRETANANLRLTGSMTHALLSGSVNLTDISFTPAFDLSSAVNQFSGAVGAPSRPGFAQNLALNVALNSTGNSDLVSRTLSVNGAANLQIRGTASEPVILGRVNLTSGDVILNGNRFVLTGGTVQFINPAMTQPVLNVSLTTTIQEYKIDLRFQGPSDQLRTQYTSDPSLPPADIINLLAFGETTEASAMNNTPMNQQAEGLVASQVSSQVTSRISKAAGISQLSISPVLAGGTAAGPPGANLTIQQRITGNLFVTFSTNVSTTQGQTIQGQYQVSPRVAISATRDPNGGFAVDTLIKKSW